MGTVAKQHRPSRIANETKRYVSVTPFLSSPTPYLCSYALHRGYLDIVGMVVWNNPSVALERLIFTQNREKKKRTSEPSGLVSTLLAGQAGKQPPFPGIQIVLF
jgi:hypothetical protein